MLLCLPKLNSLLIKKMEIISSSIRLHTSLGSSYETLGRISGIFAQQMPVAIK